MSANIFYTPSRCCLLLAIAKKQGQGTKGKPKTIRIMEKFYPRFRALSRE
jgi:hypothetical protein